MDRLFNRALQDLGLTNAHGHVLAVVLAHGPLRVADIAARTGFEASTTSRLVAELVRRRMVRRLPDPDDGRATLIATAYRGEALHRNLDAAIAGADEELLRQLPARGLKGLLRMLDALGGLP